MTKENHLVGSFNVLDIPPAPRGAPQIEVTFNVDKCGILSLSAVDTSTNKNMTIVTKKGGGLPNEEIDRLVNEIAQYKL